MSFTTNFNYCMEQKGYSAYRLAKIIGASNQGVVNWLAGANIPHPKTRQKIADHFGITLAELDGDALPTLPKEGAKKDPAETGEVSSAKKALINLIVDLDEEQCRKLRSIIEEAVNLL